MRGKIESMSPSLIPKLLSLGAKFDWVTIGSLLRFYWPLLVSIGSYLGFCWVPIGVYWVLVGSLLAPWDSALQGLHLAAPWPLLDSRLLDGLVFEQHGPKRPE